MPRPRRRSRRARKEPPEIVPPKSDEDHPHEDNEEEEEEEGEPDGSSRVRRGQRGRRGKLSKSSKADVDDGENDHGSSSDDDKKSGEGTDTGESSKEQEAEEESAKGETPAPRTRRTPKKKKKTSKSKDDKDELDKTPRRRGRQRRTPEPSSNDDEGSSGDEAKKSSRKKRGRQRKAAESTSDKDGNDEESEPDDKPKQAQSRRRTRKAATADESSDEEEEEEKTTSRRRRRPRKRHLLEKRDDESKSEPAEKSEELSSNDENSSEDDEQVEADKKATKKRRGRRPKNTDPSTSVEGSKSEPAERASEESPTNDHEASSGDEKRASQKVTRKRRGKQRKNADPSSNEEGSKSKPAEKAIEGSPSNADEDSSEEDEKADPPKRTSRRRSRKRKIADASSNDEGSKSKSSEKSEEPSSNDDEEGSNDDEKMEVRKAPKRRRGRSRKSPEASSNDEGSKSEHIQKPTRRRQRKKTFAQSSIDDSGQDSTQKGSKQIGKLRKSPEPSSDDDSDEEKESESQKETPRRRGRPRKTSQPSAIDEETENQHQGEKSTTGNQSQEKSSNDEGPSGRGHVEKFRRRGRPVKTSGALEKVEEDAMKSDDDLSDGPISAGETSTAKGLDDSKSIDNQGTSCAVGNVNKSDEGIDTKRRRTKSSQNEEKRIENGGKAGDKDEDYSQKTMSKSKSGGEDASSEAESASVTRRSKRQRSELQTLPEPTTDGKMKSALEKGQPLKRYKVEKDTSMGDDENTCGTEKEGSMDLDKAQSCKGDDSEKGLSKTRESYEARSGDHPVSASEAVNDDRRKPSVTVSESHSKNVDPSLTQDQTSQATQDDNENPPNSEVVASGVCSKPDEKQAQIATDLRPDSAPKVAIPKGKAVESKKPSEPTSAGVPFAKEVQEGGTPIVAVPTPAAIPPATALKQEAKVIESREPTANAPTSAAVPLQTDTTPERIVVENALASPAVPLQTDAKPEEKVVESAPASPSVPLQTGAKPEEKAVENALPSAAVPLQTDAKPEEKAIENALPSAVPLRTDAKAEGRVVERASAAVPLRPDAISEEKVVESSKTPPKVPTSSTVSLPNVVVKRPDDAQGQSSEKGEVNASAGKPKISNPFSRLATTAAHALRVPGIESGTKAQGEGKNVTKTISVRKSDSKNDTEDSSRKSVQAKTDGMTGQNDDDDSDEFHDAQMELPETPVEELRQLPLTGPVKSSNGATIATAPLIPQATELNQSAPLPSTTLESKNSEGGKEQTAEKDIEVDKVSIENGLVKVASKYDNEHPDLQTTRPENTPACSTNNAKEAIARNISDEDVDHPDQSSAGAASAEQLMSSSVTESSEDDFDGEAKEPVYETRRIPFSSSAVTPPRANNGTKAVYGFDRNKLDKVKAILYSTGSKVHRGHGFERIFAQYWDAVMLRLSDRLSTHASRQCDVTVQSFLKSPKLRRVHNKFILSIMKRSLKSFAPMEQISCHIPARWHSRVKRIDKVPVQDPEKLLFPTKSMVGRKAKDVSIYDEAWERMRGCVSTVPEVTRQFSSQDVDVKKIHASSSSIPGALVIDPLVREMAERSNMRVSENAVWLLIIAAREHTKTVLKNAITCKTDVEQGEVPATFLQYPRVLAGLKNASKRDMVPEKQDRPPLADNIQGKFQSRKVVSSIDILASSASMPSGSSASLGGSVSSTALERCLYSSFDSSPFVPGPDFSNVQSYIVKEITSLARERKHQLPVPSEDKHGQTPQMNETKQLPSISSSGSRTQAVAEEVAQPGIVLPPSVQQPPPRLQQPKSVTAPHTMVVPNATLVPGASVAEKKEEKPVVGLGRGAKNLAALMQRAAPKPDLEPAATPNTNTTAQLKGRAENPTTAQNKVNTSSKVSDSGSKEDIDELGVSTGSGRRGKGFGSKNLAALRARSSGQKNEESSKEVGNRDAVGPATESPRKEAFVKPNVGVSTGGKNLAVMKARSDENRAGAKPDESGTSATAAIIIADDGKTGNGQNEKPSSEASPAPRIGGTNLVRDGSSEHATTNTEETKGKAAATPGPAIAESNAAAAVGESKPVANEPKTIAPANTTSETPETEKIVTDPVPQVTTKVDEKITKEGDVNVKTSPETAGSERAPAGAASKDEESGQPTVDSQEDGIEDRGDDARLREGEKSVDSAMGKVKSTGEKEGSATDSKGENSKPGITSSSRGGADGNAGRTGSEEEKSNAATADGEKVIVEAKGKSDANPTEVAIETATKAVGSETAEKETSPEGKDASSEIRSTDDQAAKSESNIAKDQNSDTKK